MKFRLDHVVLAVGDLDRTAADYRELGFNVQIGGRHPTRTSHNALIVFEDGAYIELIAWLSPMPERWFDAHREHGDGLMDFALLPEDTTRAISEAASRGLALSGPLDGGRRRPDGKELLWQTARQATFDLPFLCGDLTPRELRVPAGEGRRHANGALGIATLVVAVSDPGASLARYLALLGVPRAGGPGVCVTPPLVLPGAGVRMAAIELEGTALMLMTPAGAQPSGRSSLARELRERLERRGEGPCAIAIRGGADAEARLFDPRLTHGVLMEIGP